MLLPRIRAELGARDLARVEAAIATHAPPRRSVLEGRLAREGLDAVLSDPAFAVESLAGDEEPLTRVSLPLLTYALARQALAGFRIDRSDVADYVATILVEFARGRRAFQPGGQPEHETPYLVDLLLLARNGHPEATQHLGDFALWMAGLYPDRVQRRSRKGGPGLPYYDTMGRIGYEQAASLPAARDGGLGEILLLLARHFPAARRALNRVSDTLLFPPSSADPVERMLRHLQDGGD